MVMSPTSTSNRRWACEMRAKPRKTCFFSLLFCIPRLGQVRDLQSGTSNSAGKSLFIISGVLASILGNFCPIELAFFVHKKNAFFRRPSDLGPPLPSARDSPHPRSTSGAGRPNFRLHLEQSRPWGNRKLSEEACGRPSSLDYAAW